ncbi:hypothetical protein IJO12_06760 [bacterium]|nr:hypothetical protein [bacterium]
MVKRFLGSILLFICGTFQAFALPSEIITLDKNAVVKPEINTQDRAEVIKGTLLINDSEELAKIIDEQKEHDVKDLELLWKGTVENNQVIEFALKKLASPESQRRIHSSLMAKTLSAIVSGASFVPCLMGSNPAIQTSAFSAGRLAQSLINRKNVPQETPLTDTELIVLASMIEDLQDTLVSSYYNYKNTLMQLKTVRSKMILYSKNYSNALDTKNVMEIAISTTLYDSIKLQEYELEQSAKKYHLQLQRLAGKRAVDALEMYQYDFDSVLYQQKNDNNKMHKSGVNK